MASVPTAVEVVPNELVQEQMMEMARIIAGYSLGEADVLRSAMGKKDKFR